MSNFYLLSESKKRTTFWSSIKVESIFQKKAIFDTSEKRVLGEFSVFEILLALRYFETSEALKNKPSNEEINS